MKNNKVKIKTIHKCRICSHNSLTNVLHLSDMPFTDEFISQSDLGCEFLSHIDIHICNQCGVVQNLKNIDMSDYYKDYRYSVLESRKAKNFMKDLAIKAVKKINKKNPSVLEIGSGDGGQLIHFLNLGCQVLGFEPSEFLADLARKNGINTVTGLFEKDSAEKLPKKFRKDVDIVVLSYTFDHLPDPLEFLKEVRRVLSDNGILIIEIHDLSKITERNEYCLFEHEHFIYLNEKTAEMVANLSGFKIVDFNLVDEKLRRGNSLLFVAEKSNYQLKINKEKDHLTKLKRNISKEIKKLDSYVKSQVDKGYKVAGFGAGGRGVMTLAAMNTASLFSYLIDSNPKGDALFTPKSHVRVHNLSILETDPVDIIIVFSYGYLEEITNSTMEFGYKKNQIISMLDIEEP